MVGIHFNREASLRAKNNNQNLPFTHANIKEPNKTVRFDLDQVYSPQAKTPSSLTKSKSKSKKKKKNNVNSTKTFLRKRLGEDRFNEIMSAIATDKDFSYGTLNDILTPAEKDLGLYIFTVMNTNTPKTDSSFREASKGKSKFRQQSKNLEEF